MTTFNRRNFLGTAALAIGATAFSAPVFADGHADHVVEIKGHKFSPANLTIAAGETVEFINRDGAPHTATANDGSFETARLRKDDHEVVTFETAGAFDYFCAVHPGMKGQIIVE